MSELEQEIRRRGGNVPLDMSVKAHLFQYEVDESLAEPYHSQTYNMVYDTPCSIFLNSIRVRAKPKPESDDDESGWDDEDQEDQDDVRNPDAQFRKSTLEALVALGANLSHVRLALWVLVGILFLSLFV